MQFVLEHFPALGSDERMRQRNPSPLRYPGGKASLSQILASIIEANGLRGCTYIEPFAGGVGAGLKLLEAGVVDHLVINDADPAIFSFWWAALNRTDAFVEKLRTTALTIDEWKSQRSTYNSSGRISRIDRGFSAFFLNRCNRSGIIKNGGPIGGIEQSGDWKIDARFNRESLIKRIEAISERANSITVLNLDAEHLVKNIPAYVKETKRFVYADPPYFVKGQNLYLNHYREDDHRAFAEAILAQDSLKWVVTYDNVPAITDLYQKATHIPFTLRYSAHADSKEGSELLIAPKHLEVPAETRRLLTSGGFIRPPEKGH